MWVADYLQFLSLSPHTSKPLCRVEVLTIYHNFTQTGKQNFKVIMPRRLLAMSAREASQKNITPWIAYAVRYASKFESINILIYVSIST